MTLVPLHKIVSILFIPYITNPPYIFQWSYTWSRKSFSAMSESTFCNV